MTTSRFAALLLLFIATACGTIATPIAPSQAADNPTVAKLEALGGFPCENSTFTCVTLTVPLDHSNVADERTLDVTFAVLPATGERKGMFVTATGGPGSSGIASADSYTAAFDPAIPEHFDIVFFDQRGAYQSGNLQCPVAAATYYATDGRAITAEQEAALLVTARTFAEDCVAEMDVDVSTLPFYGTAQAVEDLELFRQAIGDEQFWLYGESYGTQYAQTYAAAHPDRLAGLILDGTVDLTQSGVEYYRDQATAFSDVLIATLEDCAHQIACAETVANGDLRSIYDRLYTEAEDAPLSLDFPLGSGQQVARTLTLADLETAAAGYLYSTGSRQLFQRAIAAVGQNNRVPLARVLYNTQGADADTLQVAVDPTYSDALFFAVECNDYNWQVGSAEASAEAYLRAGDALDETLPYFSSLFYGDLPCVYWPAQAPAERPAPLTAEDYPVLVLNATMDPATPAAGGRRVFERLADGYLIEMEGGPHIIYGRGDACVDDPVTAFLVDGAVPTERITLCEGVVADAFIPPAPPDAAAFADPLDAMNAVYDEINNLPEYYYWDYATLTVVGCDSGGTLAFASASGGHQFRLSSCAFSEGWVMTGSGIVDDETGSFTLDLMITGYADGHLIYTIDAEGNISLAGEYKGQPV
ncbi:MAG: alpha/beta fold hydrolase [Anaerolineae bacterium]|nr:alpha/beta fold hydrolase [Anaerolineae bacterium]